MFAYESGSGTPIVLLHGFGLDHRSLLPLEPTFDSASGWRRIYLDLPGATGTAVGSVKSTQDVADAVSAEIRQRLGDERFAVLGNSFGGMIARSVAHELRAQVLGLATIAGVFEAQSARRELPVRTVLRTEPRIDSILGDTVDVYREDAVVESVEDARDFVRYIHPGMSGADEGALEKIAQRYSLIAEPESAHPEPFVPPSLHITGRQDHVVGYADAWRTIEHYPRGTFATLDGAGHNLLIEQAALCSALVTEWLTRMSQ